MKVVLAGGSGFLGSALSAALAARGDEVLILARRSHVQWNPDGTAGPWSRVIDGAGAVINLAGEPIAGRRWSAERKRRILESRVRATRSLAAAIHAAARPPRVFLSASGVGYYPDAEEAVDETAAPGGGFLARVCVAWETEAREAASDRTRVVLLRTGVVLHRNGGALEKLILPFKLGAGGPIGSGRQWWAWIHRDDWVRMVLWAIDRDEVEGPLNVCAPEPARNADIMRALARALHRPALIPTPAFALRLAFGEMADEMLLASQRAVPRVAGLHGFDWTFRDLDAAMRDAVRSTAA